MSAATFDPGELLDEARQATGLTDFGADDFREGLAVLLQTYDANGYDDAGRRRNRGRVLGLLMERLRIEDALETHPEIRDVEAGPLMKGRSFDRHELGPAVLEYLARKMEHSVACRQTLDASRTIGIQFDDIVAEPVAAVHRIYDHFRIPMSVELDATFEVYARAHPQGERGTHDYKLDDYGLSEQQILDRFAFYADRFVRTGHGRNSLG